MYNATNDFTERDSVEYNYKKLCANKFKDSIQQAKRKDFKLSLINAIRDFSMLIAFVAAVIVLFIAVGQ